MKTYDEASAESLDIALLCSVRAALGRGYKAAIRRAWETGRYDENGLREWALDLQRIRNARGPSWLVDACVTWLSTIACRTDSGLKALCMRDRNGAECGVQASSSAFEECLWVGITDPQPMVKAEDAASAGVATTEVDGWVKYPLPAAVKVTTRMHLTRAQAGELAHVLREFSESGRVTRVIRGGDL